MLFWLMAGIVTYILTLYAASGARLFITGTWVMVGPRDNLPAPTPIEGRLQRAAENYAENLPIFLALAVLALLRDGADTGQAVLGAQIFVLARVAYLPAYLSGVPLLRSAVYGVTLAGLLVMALAAVN